MRRALTRSLLPIAVAALAAIALLTARTPGASHLVRPRSAPAMLLDDNSRAESATFSTLRATYTDGERVVVRGRVINARMWTSVSGARYYRFQVAEGHTRVRVLYAGTTLCEDGARATVEGVYREERVIDGRRLQPHIEAAVVRCDATSAGRR